MAVSPPSASPTMRKISSAISSSSSCRRPAAGEAVAVVESVKAASDVFTPLSGEVVEVNGDLVDRPALVNEDAEGKAWFFKIKVADEAELAALMDRAAYQRFVKEGG